MSDGTDKRKKVRRKLGKREITVIIGAIAIVFLAVNFIVALKVAGKQNVKQASNSENSIVGTDNSSTLTESTVGNTVGNSDSTGVPDTQTITSSDSKSLAQSEAAAEAENKAVEAQKEAISKSVEQDAASIAAKQAENAQAPPVEQTEAPVQTSQQETDSVSQLAAASKYNQLIVVSAHGVTADVSMHEKQNGVWTQIMSTQGYVGKDGVGTASETSSHTPAGTFDLTFAFGVNPDPGCAIGYTQVDDSDYWVDDSASKYYNQFVSTNQVTPDWTSAEHLMDKNLRVAYAYAININYNMSHTPGAGSAIFLHCSNGAPTAGCVSIPQSYMIFVLTHIGGNCAIVIGEAGSIGGGF